MFPRRLSVVSAVIFTCICAREGDIFDRAIDPTTQLKSPYHMYDPSLFDMFTECAIDPSKQCGKTAVELPKSKSGLEKHSVDFMFLKSLIRLNASVAPERAKLFVVPVLYSLSIQHMCGDHISNYNQMHYVLNRLGHYREGFRNHLIIAVENSTCTYSPRLIHCNACRTLFSLTCTISGGGRIPRARSC